MTYHVIDPSEVEPMEGRSATARSITDAAGLENMGARVYEGAPGDQIPLVYHYHDTQEELFYVSEGELHVETPEREYVVGPGELFAVESGNPHRAFNPADADSSVLVVAIGAPAADDGHEYDPEYPS